MEKFKVIEIKQSVYESNEKRAAALRADLKKDTLSYQDY